jgi:hypothetical protein
MEWSLCADGLRLLNFLWIKAGRNSHSSAVAKCLMLAGSGLTGLEKLSVNTCRSRH